MKNFRIIEKELLKKLLSVDKLEQLQHSLFDITTIDEHKDLANETLLNAGRLGYYQNALVNGTASNQELEILRNQIRQSFLIIINKLPDEITINDDPTIKQKILMTKLCFKAWLFRIVLIGKLALMGIIIFQIDTGGFTKEQGLSVITLSIPLLATIMAIHVADIIHRKKEILPMSSDRQIISNSFRNMVFACIFAYFLLFLFLISQYTIGNFQQTDGDADFKTLMIGLAIFESGFGILIGAIIYGLFKEK